MISLLYTHKYTHWTENCVHRASFISKWSLQCRQIENFIVAQFQVFRIPCSTVINREIILCTHKDKHTNTNPQTHIHTHTTIVMLFCGPRNYPDTWYTFGQSHEHLKFLSKMFFFFLNAKFDFPFFQISNWLTLKRMDSICG